MRKRSEHSRAGGVRRSLARVIRSAGCAVLAVALMPAAALAGNFGVSPIRLDLDRNTRSGSVTVSNDDEAPLLLQIKVYAWTQDAEGKDQYEESSELTYSPRLMTLQPKEQRIVRAGVRIPAAAQEKAYRLFIEEIPEPQKAQQSGGQVAVAIRFGVPVFVKPLVDEFKAEIVAPAVSKGVLTLGVKNSGNSHFRIQSIKLQSGELFSTELPGWYLLPGNSRTQTATLPADVCRKLGELEITVKTDRQDLKSKLSLDPAQCQ